jgi:hypothetical protein
MDGRPDLQFSGEQSFAPPRSQALLDERREQDGGYHDLPSDWRSRVGRKEGGGFRPTESD